MINTCLNVNQIAPTGPQTKRYAKMLNGEEPSSIESVSERHDTVDEPVKETNKYEQQITEEELQEFEQQQYEYQDNEPEDNDS